MRATHKYGYRLSSKQVYHQALVKMSESLLISWRCLIPGLKQAVRRGVLLGPWKALLCNSGKIWLLKP